MPVVHTKRRRTRFGSPLSWLSQISLPILTIVLLLAFPHVSIQASTLGERSLEELSVQAVESLVSLRDSVKNIDPTDPSSHLSRILIPRPADSDNNTLVRNYIVSTLKALNWEVEEDIFTDDTPYGTKRFTNVIATKDPSASRRVILSAHFDSKYFSSFPQNQFVGATDSAFPCALMLDLAETLDPLLNARKERLEQGLEEDDEVADTTLQLVFFDGEEAFREWTATDSVYGARHLAEKWATTFIAPHTKRHLPTPSASEISTIEHLILLDLLGAPNPFIRSAFLDTAWLFDGLVAAERRLASSGAFAEDGIPNPDIRSFFIPRRAGEGNMNYVEDDHIPFLKRGVSILHVIATPFPRVWHTLSDDASALDLPTMRRWNLIFRVFFAEYLGLRPEVRSSREDRNTHSSRSHEELVRRFIDRRPNTGLTPRLTCVRRLGYG
ncbi:hypothetical protein JAAARDRAFT_124587 [Jaapia argillacea MUCL 33604]|uniref:Peptide hydrolase n=1 Tax=Jaapia argillacea MUCL 33604 TaxID=933084 RepID=A0A067QEV8_9AGAM|nr:hypothetical protein JAAARDRAFT_124587 [Jaapia argillacea MUCL 33604]